KHGPRQEVESIGQIVLNSDIDDVPIFFHGWPLASSTCRGSVALFERNGRKTLERLVGGINYDPNRLERRHAQKRLCTRSREDHPARSHFSHELNPNQTKGK